MAKKVGLNKDFASFIRNKIQKYGEKVAADVAHTIENELEESTLYAIAAFYSSYTPNTYERHYFNFMDRSFMRYYHHSSGSNRFYGGVVFTPGAMADIYQDDTREVFETVVMEGFHGPAGMIGMGYAGVGEYPYAFDRIPPRMYPTPYQLVCKDRDKIASNIQTYIDNAQKKNKL